MKEMMWDDRTKAGHGRATSLSLGLLVVLLIPCGVFGQAESEPADEARAAQTSPRDARADGPSDRAAKPQATENEPAGRFAGFDTSNIKLSGADLTYEIVGDQLILKGNMDDLDLIEALVAVLEQSTEQKELRVITVTEKDANEIARAIEKPLQDAFGYANQPEEEKVSVTALSSNIVLVTAIPSQIDFIEQMILQVDQTKDQLPDLEQMVFPVKYRKAADVAEQLKEIVAKFREKQGAKGAKGELQIIANNANNTIMVLAPQTEREKIQKLLNEIDVEPVPGWGEVKLTFYPLLHSKADELAKTIEDLLDQEQGREAAEETIYRMLISKVTPSGELIELPPIDLQKPTRIIPDEGTNSLIIATVEENVGPMGELVRLLDGVAVAEGIDLKLLPLRFADAETVRDLLRDMFAAGKDLPKDPDGSGEGAVPEGLVGRALVYEVGIEAHVRTNTLILTGRTEQLELAQTIVAQIDRPATGLKFPLRMFMLEHTDATRIGQIVTELFDQRFEAAEAMGATRAALERERVFLSIDIRTNSLILSASDENYEEITSIARQLDTKPAKLFDQIRIIRCERLSATDLKQKIEDLWQRKADLRREEEMLEDLPVVVADERSNALVIASSVEDFEEIRLLVLRLEALPLIDDTQLFLLEFADAKVLAGMLDELFQGMESGSEAFKAPTVIPDERSNMLVVAGARDALERAADLIGRLDVKAGPLTAIFKVYPLAHASAAKLANRMQELFDSRREGQDAERTPIVILAEETSNSLVCSASRDDHEVVENLLSLLDKPSNIARQVEMFPLKLARATSVAEKLESLFAMQGDGASGRVDAIATVADERTNSLIVWASPSEMANIAEMVHRLDTATPAVEMMVKVIQLRQALAEDFAQLLEETLFDDQGGEDEPAVILSFVHTDAEGKESTRKLLRQDIRIKPDPRTNSLMVMAPSDSMAMLETMIRDFDRVTPIRSEIRLIPLANSDADSMVDILDEIFSPESGDEEGAARRQLVFGSGFDEMELASVGQELRFTADTRTNTLMVAGAEVDLNMIEDLVLYLDAQAADERITEVIYAKYRDAQEIANAVQGFVQQEQDVLGEIDDDEARSRRMERQISIEAVGQEGEGSSSLIVGTDARAYQRTMDMIRQLDRPEPQVMIKVLIAEVGLNDSIELGMEIAGQNLHFSEGAVLGPNGIVKGSDFDFSAGTDLGAAGLGLGGFNFTMTGEDFGFLFHALQTESRVEILSRPILLVRNGQEGNITIADQIPIVESSRLNDTGQTQSTIGREDVGIVLTATPQISPDGYVTIALKQEISNVAGENVQLTEGVSSPIFQTREVETNVTVRDGETVVIGGLIQKRKSESENKVPILGDLPWIGPLFRSTSVTESRVELLIVLTVDILRTDEDVEQMSREMRDQYTLSEESMQSPLMGGLRILPEDTRLGPVDDAEIAKPEPRSDEPARPEPKRFGPRPRIYGPVISPPPSARDTVARPVYGPKVARGGASEL